MSKNSTFEIVSSVTGQKNIVPIPVLYVRAFGSWEAAAMLTQLTYWDDRLDPEKDGWQYRTESDWFDELSFTRREIERARRDLLERDVIEYKVKGAPPKSHYRVKPEALIDYLAEMCANSEWRKRTNRNGGSVQINPSETVQIHIQEPTQNLPQEPTAPTPPLLVEPKKKKTVEERKSSRADFFKGKVVREKNLVELDAFQDQLKEMAGDKFHLVERLVQESAIKPSTVLGSLKRTPRTLSALLTLSEQGFDEIMAQAKMRAAGFMNGPESNVGWQFIMVLTERGPDNNSSNTNVSQTDNPLASQTDIVNPHKKGSVNLRPWVDFAQKQRRMEGYRRDGYNLEIADQLEQELREEMKQHGH